MSENEKRGLEYYEPLRAKHSKDTVDPTNADRSTLRSFAPESGAGTAPLQSSDIPPTFRKSANDFFDALAALEKSVEDKHYRFGQHVDDLIMCNEIAERVMDVATVLEAEIRDDVGVLHRDLNPEPTPKRRRAAKPKTAPYQHPADEKLTWAGKGRKPKWLKDELDAGAELDEFKV